MFSHTPWRADIKSPPCLPAGQQGSWLFLCAERNEKTEKEEQCHAGATTTCRRQVAPPRNWRGVPGIPGLDLCGWFAMTFGASQEASRSSHMPLSERKMQIYVLIYIDNRARQSDNSLGLGRGGPVGIESIATGLVACVFFRDMAIRSAGCGRKRTPHHNWRLQAR